MPLLPVATDEDLIEKCTGDWPVLVPSTQRLASGTDGVFLSSDRWTLSSASNDFAAQGVAAGNLAILSVEGGRGRSDILAVASVGNLGVKLRRVGMIAGVGQAPSPLGGQTGVQFDILTAKPQIDTATFDVQRRFNIDSLADLQDPDDLKRPVVLTVLWTLYLQASENASAMAGDHMAAKAKIYRALLDCLMDSLDATYATQAASSRYLSGAMAPAIEPPLIPGY